MWKSINSVKSSVIFKNITNVNYFVENYICEIISTFN